MSNRVFLKSSGVANAVPDFTDLDLAELCWNYRDGKLYAKINDGESEAILDLTSFVVGDLQLTAPAIVGRPVGSGAGTAQELTPSQATALLPAATASNDGKMTAAQAGYLYPKKKITGTLHATAGGTTTVLHGLDQNKILSCAVFVEYNSNLFHPSFTRVSGAEFNYHISSTAVVIRDIPGNGSAILGQPYRISIEYEE